MKKYFLLLLFITTVSVNAQITFQKTFGDVAVGYSVQTTTEGGFILAGYTSSFGAGSHDVYLMKMDANGDTLWTKTFGGAGNDYGYSVIQTTDGGYIIAGTTESFGSGYTEVYLIRIDSNGDSLWTKTFGGTSLDEGNNVQVTTDGGCVIIGTRGSNICLIKINSDGDLLWTKTYGGSSTDIGNSVQQTMDGGYIIVGSTASFGAGVYDVYLVKVNANGELMWTKAFGGAGTDLGSSVQQTIDGGFIIAGYTSSFGAGSSDVFLIKTDTNGDSLWTKTYGGLYGDEGQSIQQSNDGGYIILGYTEVSVQVKTDIYLIKIDANGDSLWTKTFGGSGWEEGKSIKQTSDEGFIILGWSDSFAGGTIYSDFYLIKTDSYGNSGCNESRRATIVTSLATQITSPATIVTSPNTIVTNPATIVGSGGLDSTLCTSVGINEIAVGNGFVISPNPVSSQCTIQNSQCMIKSIDVYNLVGEKMRETENPNWGQWTIDCRLLSPGIYFVNVISENGRAIQKLIVQR